ncbi:unnamed protein product [Hermetia illucens]|uniref:Uncharacterized protein n=1 Tax=Hermetia illucens TaxID=343691 RepID=A0A7R8UG06_HERIL|nr:unnamed protein product [Hermetia illucens]
MAKIFNEKIINSLRKNNIGCEERDSSGYDPGETYVIQEVDARKRKKPVFRRKHNNQSNGHRGSGDSIPNCCYCKVKSGQKFVTSTPLVACHQRSPHHHRAETQSKIYENPHKSNPRSSKLSETESDQGLRSTSKACGDISVEAEATSIDDGFIESKSSNPLLPAVLEECSDKVPGLCFDELCDPPGHLDYKNVSLFRSILGPYPDEPLLAMIDKFLSFIGFGGGLCAKDMNKLAMLDDVVEYMPDYED